MHDLFSTSATTAEQCSVDRAQSRLKNLFSEPPVRATSINEFIMLGALLYSTHGLLRNGTGMFGL